MNTNLSKPFLNCVSAYLAIGLNGCLGTILYSSKQHVKNDVNINIDCAKKTATISISTPEGLSLVDIHNVGRMISDIGFCRLHKVSECRYEADADLEDFVRKSVIVFSLFRETHIAFGKLLSLAAPVVASRSLVNDNRKLAKVSHKPRAIDKADAAVGKPETGRAPVFSCNASKRKARSARA